MARMLPFFFLRIINTHLLKISSRFHVYQYVYQVFNTTLMWKRVCPVGAESKAGNNSCIDLRCLLSPHRARTVTAVDAWVDDGCKERPGSCEKEVDSKNFVICLHVRANILANLQN